MKKRWLRWSLALVATCSLVAGGLAAPASGQVAGTVDCPTAYPVAALSRGMAAVGFTVAQGVQPEEFQVEILGVLPDAIGPGRDMIVVDTDSPAIDDAGGIWAGMSGSPVYIDGKLVGALAFGLSEGPSSIAGLTPAGDMLDLLRYPTGNDASPHLIAPEGKLRRVVERRTGDAEVAFTTLAAPLSVSGGPRVLDTLAAGIEREKLPLIPYAGSSASTDQTTGGGPLHAGDSFAATFSYGDITIAEIGTLTLSCEGKGIAFGHPMSPYFPLGDTTMGANAAEVMAIVDNPNYKLAKIGAQVGMVDQDRLAGVRGLFGSSPPSVPITSRITAVDIGKILVGRTDVVVAEMAPTIANVHLVSSVDSAFDQVGTGSVTATWTINGTRETGEPWQFTRTNLFASTDDISRDSFGEITQELFTLLFNPFEDVELTSLDASVEVREEVRRYEMVDMLAGVNGSELRHARTVNVEARDTINLRLVIRDSEAPEDGSQDQFLDLELRVPRRPAGDGYITVRGGRQGGGYYGGCFYDPEYCGRVRGNVDSFDALLLRLGKKRTNNSAMATLKMGRRRVSVVSKDTASADQVVIGYQSLRVRVSGASGGGSGEPPPVKGPIY